MVALADDETHRQYPLPRHSFHIFSQPLGLCVVSTHQSVCAFVTFLLVHLESLIYFSSQVVGRRKPMILAHVLFVAASVAASLAPTVELLIVARALEGIAACTFVIIGQGQIGDVFGKEKLGKAMATFSLVRMSAGSLSSPLPTNSRSRIHAAAVFHRV